ncbi:MAG: NUDIX domain-containing protein [Candidatus Sabulitectum sp.]|nr:NUDIX domain-containing protein [Candidatus Sabulitectum sp.]
MIRQFGNRISGVSYIERPGAYAVIVNSTGEIAVIKAGIGYHLPGGGIRPRELPEEAVKREILEETGLVFRVEEIIGTANQYCYSLY